MNAPMPEAGHAFTARRSDVLPRGWTEAWIWVCECGTESHSILRDRQAAARDHHDEHLVHDLGLVRR